LIWENSTQWSAFDLEAGESTTQPIKADLVVMEVCGASGWFHDFCHELDLPTLACGTHEDAWR